MPHILITSQNNLACRRGRIGGSVNTLRSYMVHSLRVAYTRTTSDVGIIRGRHFMLVVVNGFNPLKGIFISTLDYLGEGRIYPNTPMY